MTERTPTRQPRGAPSTSDAPNEFWQMMEAWFEERTKDFLPVAGTVIGDDNGVPRVKLDSDEDDRQVGFPRSKGVQYAKGARVLTQKLKNGERVILGVVDSSNDERAIAGPQLHDNSVGARVLGPNAVEGANIKGRAIGFGHLDQGIENDIKGAQQKSEMGKYAQKSDIPDVSNLAKQSQVNDHDDRIKKLEKRVFKK